MSGRCHATLTRGLCGRGGDDSPPGRTRDDQPLNHADHVALIADGVRGNGGRWLELGCGEGAFTLALADVLGPGGEIVALDRDPGALRAMSQRVAERFPAVRLEPLRADFTDGLPEGPFDGVLAANSLHFVRDRGPVLAAIRGVLTADGRLVVVEYDADDGNPWVPYPFSFESWRREAVNAGYAEPRRMHRVPSRFLGAIYGAVTEAAPTPPPTPPGPTLASPSGGTLP